MKYTPDDRTEHALGDRVEALVELAAEDPDFADWHDDEGTLVAAGVDGSSQSVVASWPFVTSPAALRPSSTGC